jgi:hypothetical protein
MDLISEFFFEGIRRILPGVTVIFLYWRAEISHILDGRFFQQNQIFSSEYMLLFGLLSICWVIGFVLDAFPFAVWKIPQFLFMILTKYGLRSENCRRAQAQKAADQDKGKNKSLQRENRRLGFLADAEKRMCRAMWLIFLYGVFLKEPDPIGGYKWRVPFSVYDCSFNFSFCFLAFLVFFICWLYYKVAHCWERKLTE